ncbi:CoA transferase subunit A [Chloroflexota bacterium]
MMAIDKTVTSFDNAVADIHDGAVIGSSFWAGPVTSPENLVRALARKGSKNLTLVGFTGGGRGQQMQETEPTRASSIPGAVDWAILVEQGLVNKVVSSFPFVHRHDTPVNKAWKDGNLQVEHFSHGTLAVRLWAAGAGVGGVYVRTGVKTVVEEGKEKRVFGNEEYILELPLKLDFALIRAYKADKFGNLIYRGVGRATGPLMAKAATMTIAEVDEIVEPGMLDPEHIITPGIYVHRVVQVPKGGSE